MFNNLNIGIILLISHILSAIIIGIIYTPSSSSSIIQQKNTNSNSFCKLLSPFDTLYKSILGSLKTLALIYSYTVIFSLIPELLIRPLNLNENIQSVLLGIFEISNGINSISLLNIKLELKLCLISFVLSFSSLMVLMQIYSFVTIAKVKFKDIVKYKFIQGILSAAITYLLLNFIPKDSISVFVNIQNTINTNYYLTPSVIYMLAVIITIFICMVIYRKKRHI